MGLFWKHIEFTPHRPDLRNFSLEDLLYIKFFEELSPEEQIFKMDDIFFRNSTAYRFFNRFGIYYVIPEDNDKWYNGEVKFKPWYEPITQTVEELLKLDLPTRSMNEDGTFKGDNKWREGIYDIGYYPYILDTEEGFIKVLDEHGFPLLQINDNNVVYTKIDNHLYCNIQEDKIQPRI